MCVVSMIMDHYYDKWAPFRPSRTVPDVIPVYPIQPPPIHTPPVTIYPLPNLPTQKEIDEFRQLLEKAREYDKRNNEPDCELQSKKDRLLKLAQELGIKIDFV